MTTNEKAQTIFKEFLLGSTVYAKTSSGDVILESIGVAENKLIGYVVLDNGQARRLDVTNSEFYKYCPFTIVKGEENLTAGNE